jgi:hypothetical protein
LPVPSPGVTDRPSTAGRLVAYGVLALIPAAFIGTALLDAPQVRWTAAAFGSRPQAQAVVGGAPIGLLLLFSALGAPSASSAPSAPSAPRATAAAPAETRHPYDWLVVACMLALIGMLPPMVAVGATGLTAAQRAALAAQAYGFYGSWLALTLLMLVCRAATWLRGTPAPWPPRGRAFRWTMVAVVVGALAALVPWAGWVVEVVA